MLFPSLLEVKGQSASISFKSTLHQFSFFAFLKSWQINVFYVQFSFRKRASLTYLHTISILLSNVSIIFLKSLPQHVRISQNIFKNLSFSLKNFVFSNCRVTKFRYVESSTQRLTIAYHDIKANLRAEEIWGC